MTDPKDQTGEYRIPSGRLGVLLNANAGRVKRRTYRLLHKAAPDAPIFWTRSLEEAQDAVEAAIELGVETLFAGGGDGTIIDLANRLLGYRNRPRLGILRLGTGNALATWVHSRKIPHDLEGWGRGEAYQEVEMRFVRTEEETFPFAGMGWDAAVLNDYRWAKQYLQGTPFESKIYHLPTYLAAGLGRTAPRIATTRRAPLVSIEVLKGEAWKVDMHGNRVGPILHPGEVLYSGPAHMVAFGTTPYYGYAMRMLPHACLEAGHFTLRVSALSLPTAINQLPKIWNGTCEDDRLMDFLAESLYIRFDQEVPYQVGGDARGVREDLVLEMSPQTLPVVSFR